MDRPTEDFQMIFPASWFEPLRAWVMERNSNVYLAGPIPGLEDEGYETFFLGVKGEAIDRDVVKRERAVALRPDPTVMRATSVEHAMRGAWEDGEPVPTQWRLKFEREARGL